MPGWALAACCLTALVLLPASASSGAVAQPDGFRALEGVITPKRTVPYSVDSQRIILRFKARRSLRIEVEVVRIASGRTVRRFVTGPLRPGRWHRRYWSGLDSKGRLVASGRFLVRAGPVGSRLQTLARMKLYGHVFPVDGTSGTRGYIGEFGAGCWTPSRCSVPGSADLRSEDPGRVDGLETHPVHRNWEIPSARMDMVGKREVL